MSEQPEEKPSSAKRFIDSLNTDYANNVAYESTVWDLKLIFGEYSDQDKAVDWRTSITIPWAQAKLMQYLQINIEAYESQHGKVSIPAAMLPPEPLPVVDPNDPSQKAIHEIVLRRRESFIQDLFPNQIVKPKK